MSNPYFQFKQFTIYHDRCAMKVGTDGVLLGAWTAVLHAERILDVGTGSGLIAIMMAQRCEAFIDAIEIDDDAFKQAQANASACSWSNRIKIHHISFQQFAMQHTLKYDVIVSNPPFFKASLKSPVKARTLARHAENLTYESLLFGASHLRAPAGRLALITPAGRSDEIIREAGFYNLFPSRLTNVQSAPGKDYSRTLIEFSYGNKQICHQSTLTLHGGNGRAYSDDYRTLMADYYLGG